MRRVLLALLAAVGLTSATIAGSTLPASGELVGTYDAGVAVADVLGEIAPAGSYGLYDVTVTLDGPVAGDVLLTTGATGGTVDAEYSDCIDATGECVISLSPSVGTPDSETVRIAVQSNVDASQVDFTATVSLTETNTVGVDVNPDNDTASTSTPVDQDGVNNSLAFVPEGDSVSYSAHGQTHVLTVTNAKGSGGGAIVGLTDPGLMDCAGDPCNGVHIEFQQGGDGEAYEAETEVDSTGDHDPCRGLGSGSGCTEIYWRKLSTDSLVKVPACGTEGPSEPCLQQKYKTDTGEIHYVTEMDTDDPDLGLPDIPPLDVG